MKPRRADCKICGKPRWWKAKTAMCLEHWTEYRHDIYHQNYDQAHPEARRYSEEPSISPDRTHRMARAYDRLNIRARLDQVRKQAS